MTIHLGFSCSQHDPSIAVVNEDGKVVFAQANERALKNKRGWHAPPDAFGLIEPILNEYTNGKDISANLTWSGAALRSSRFLTKVSRGALAIINRFHPANREAWLWLGWLFRHALYRAPASANELLLNLELRLQERHDFRHRLNKNTWNHHLCHAATACFSSPFDTALCVVVDGMGEGSSTAVFSFENGKITRLDAQRYTNLASLGSFYSQACFAAGFDPHAGEEWKLMGLAAYGKLDQELYHLLRPALQVKGDHFVFSKTFAERMQQILPARKNGFRQNADLAFTAQQVFEELLFELLAAIHQRWGGENLIVTGGCALNSSANGKILAHTPFKQLHVPMAPGDDGNSVGAALLSWQAANPGKTPDKFHSPYLGSKLSTSTVERFKRHGHKPDFTAKTPQQLSDHVARALAEGAIVGWVQGRAEFGHRALGNRSILADPRPADIRDRLNAAVKFREEFRPFAPSILDEYGADWFFDYTQSPYMAKTFKWRPGLAPAGVRHADDTGRLQSVSKQNNPVFHNLISAFHKITGVPILLNTSFNVMGRPIIHDIEDALGVFYTSGLDLLVLGDDVFRKHH